MATDSARPMTRASTKRAREIEAGAGAGSTVAPGSGPALAPVPAPVSAPRPVSVSTTEQQNCEPVVKKRRTAVPSSRRAAPARKKAKGKARQAEPKVLQAAPVLDINFGTSEHTLDAGQNYKVARILDIPKVKDRTLGKPLFEWRDIAEITKQQIPFLSIMELRALNDSGTTCDAQSASDKAYNEALLVKIRLRYKFFKEDTRKSFFKNSSHGRCVGTLCKDRGCDCKRIPRHWSEILPRTGTSKRSTAVHSDPKVVRKYVGGVSWVEREAKNR